MRIIVGQLLIALGLLVPIGCALPGREIGRSDDFGFRSKDMSASQVDKSKSDRIAFKSARRFPSSDTVSADSPETVSDEAKEQTIAKTGGVQSKFLFGHSTDFSEEQGKRSKQKHDDQANPIQLQGLEFDEPHATTRKPEVVQSSGDDTAAVDRLGKSFDANSSDVTTDPEVPLWADRMPDRSKGVPPAIHPDAKSATLAPRDRPRQTSVVTGQLPPLPWQSDLELLIQRAEQELSASKPETSADGQSEYFRRQAHLRLLYLMAQRQEAALNAIPGVEPSQQEFWQQMIWAMSNSLDTIRFPESSDRASQTISPLNAALRQLRDEAPLSIKNMTFCRKILSFGNYERFPRNEFTPGQEVLLYTEIENFVSTPTVDGEYRTSLKSLIEIMDSQGKVVWTNGFPTTEDFCRNPRRDYFQNGQFHIPKELSTGTYSLRLTIADELSHKRGSSSLNFVLK